MSHAYAHQIHAPKIYHSNTYIKHVFKHIYIEWSYVSYLYMNTIHPHMWYRTRQLFSINTFYPHWNHIHNTLCSRKYTAPIKCQGHSTKRLPHLDWSTTSLVQNDCSHIQLSQVPWSTISVLTKTGPATWDLLAISLSLCKQAEGLLPYPLTLFIGVYYEFAL